MNERVKVKVHYNKRSMMDFNFYISFIYLFLSSLSFSHPMFNDNDNGELLNMCIYL